jgi:peptidyl-prolyl cis-trans isomerase D
MLTWINEKAKWIIVIFAAGIVVGLLAMDRVPKTAQSYPVGVVNDHKISYAEFDSRFKMIQQNQFQGQHLEDEQYSQLRNDIFRSFVRQILLDEQFEKAGLAASVAELKAEFKNNFQAVRGRVVQEAQYRLNAIQQQATSQEDLMQRSQAYIASLPKFITDTTATQEDYEAWLETPEAFKWGMMLQLEEEMKKTNIPMHQLQTLVSAGIHPTTLEAKWNVERRMTEFDLDVAFASASDFAVAEDVVDTAMVKGYFNAHLDSFFVENDAAKFQYVSIPVAATAADDERVREYAMTIYFQLADTSSTATFEEMARISSEDPGSAENGGILSQPAGLGVYVPEFEKAALALDSGAVSEPVKSQFGYHIIKSFGKSTDSTGKVTANVGHILLVVNASSETVDSLEKILTGIKNEVAAGKEFAAAAKERNLEVAESGWVGRNENIPELGYLKGLTSFAWPNENLPEEEGNVSPVLRNSKFVVLANKVKELKAGDRDFDMYFESIKTALKTKKSANAAGIYLNSVADKVKEWKAPAEGDSTATPVAIEKVLVQNMKSSAEGYVNGFGYSSTGLYKVLNGQKVGEWGPVIETDLGAVMVRVNSKTPAEEAAVAAAVKQEYDNGARFFASALFNDFVSKIEKSTPVECNLDLFYRD